MKSIVENENVPRRTRWWWWVWSWVYVYILRSIYEWKSSLFLSCSLSLALRKIINKSSCIIIILVLYYTTIIRFACPTAFTILSLRSHSTLYNIILAQYGSTTINTILVECVHHKILLLSFSHFSSSCLSPLSNSVRGSLLRKRF